MLLFELVQRIIGLARKGAFKKVSRAQAEGKQVIPLKWVFKYKLDEHGYLVKFKARLVVRGDLETEMAHRLIRV
jgi:hypothetical protein